MAGTLTREDTMYPDDSTDSFRRPLLPDTQDRTTSVPAGTLGDWIAADWSQGVQLQQLTALDVLAIRTRNTSYEVVVQNGRTGEVLVRGGRFFPELTAARLAGATTGGSILKLLGIYIGLHIEFELKGRRIITSPVASVSLTTARDVRT